MGFLNKIFKKGKTNKSQDFDFSGDYQFSNYEDYPKKFIELYNELMNIFGSLKEGDTAQDIGVCIWKIEDLINAWFDANKKNYSYTDTNWSFAHAIQSSLSLDPKNQLPKNEIEQIYEEGIKNPHPVNEEFFPFFKSLLEHIISNE